LKKKILKNETNRLAVYSDQSNIVSQVIRMTIDDYAANSSPGQSDIVVVLVVVLVVLVVGVGDGVGVGVGVLQNLRRRLDG